MITERARQKILRELGCLVPGCVNAGIELHHVRTAATAGVGLKPPDSSLVPLCSAHHRDLHRIGWVTFQRLHGINLASEAALLAQIDKEMP